MNTLLAPGIYQHFNGSQYELVAIAKDSENLEPIVVYRALYGEGDVWTRPLSDFVAHVDRPEYAYSGPRFILISKS